MEALIKRNLEFLDIMNAAATRIQAACVAETIFWQNIDQNVAAARAAQAEGKPIEVIPLPAEANAPPAAAISEAAVAMTNAIADFKQKMAVKNPGMALTPPPAEDMPQEDNAIGDREREAYAEFHALEMTIKQFFSPLVVHGGRGFYAPAKDQALKGYNADIARTPIERQSHWPTGFYRQEDSKARQVFIRTPRYSIILPDSMNAEFQLSITDLTDGAQINILKQDDKWFEVIRRDIIDTLSLYAPAN